MILDPASNDYVNANEVSKKVSAWNLHMHSFATEHSYLNLHTQTRGLNVESETLLMEVKCIS